MDGDSAIRDLWMATGSALLHSGDGGETWVPVEGAPGVAAVEDAADIDGVIVATDAAGHRYAVQGTHARPLAASAGIERAIEGGVLRSLELLG